MKVNSIIISAFFILILTFCGFEIINSPLIQQKPDPSQLKDKGVGPIKALKLNAVDQKLADKGSELFDSKCSPCHHINDVNLGPALRGVTKNLSPEFIMNYLMNTAEMQKKNPYVLKLIQSWKKVPMMKDQKLKEKDSRAILEFLRTQQ
jgi:cytochrome c2